MIKAMGEDDFKMACDAASAFKKQITLQGSSIGISMLTQSDLSTFQQSVRSIQQELTSKILGSETHNNVFKAINQIKDDIIKSQAASDKKLQNSILDNVTMLEENLTRQNDEIKEELSNLTARFDNLNNFFEQIEDKLQKQSEFLKGALDAKMD
jgi:hypothetical protein